MMENSGIWKIDGDYSHFRLIYGKFRSLFNALQLVQVMYLAWTLKAKRQLWTYLKYCINETGGFQERWSGESISNKNANETHD